MLSIDIQRDSDDPSPSDATLQHAASVALEIHGAPTEVATELSVRIVDVDEMRELNRRFRGQDKPTNVLSFPAELVGDLPFRHLGDIVICAAVVATEAHAQGKSEAAHWAHMLVHGALHLLGHDHENDDEAQRMERLETQALARLGWPCPYDADQPGTTTLQQNMETLA